MQKFSLFVQNTCPQSVPSSLSYGAVLDGGLRPTLLSINRRRDVEPCPTRCEQVAGSAELCARRTTPRL